MSDANLSLTIENINASENFTYMEMFQGKAHIDGDTQPIQLGSVSEPRLIIVIADRPETYFHLNVTDATEIGAFPFGVWSNVTGDPAPADEIVVSGAGGGTGGECIILAYGDA